LNPLADPAMEEAAAGALPGRTLRPAAVRLDGIAKRYGDVDALKEVRLDIAEGELMTLLGPSGCGKTTLLNVIAGFAEPDSGEVVIAGNRVTTTPPFRREIGIVFQNYALFPHMTVAGNVGYGLRMRRLPKGEIAARAAESLALVKLTGLENRRPRELSGGQQQRVALARALVIKPKLLLLDEPFSALDKNLRAAMQLELKEIQRALGVTTIFVTHDQGEALSLSDRVAVMAEGSVRQLGTPSEIYTRPSDPFVAAFIGDASVLRGRLDRVEGERAEIRVGAALFSVAASPLAGAAPGAEVRLFARPEHLRIATLGETVFAEGVVRAHAYQGGHVDLQVETALAEGGAVLIRMVGQEAMTRWPTGTRVNLALTGGPVAFAATS
jgi:ABC-type Fe3+/spermidine/putrescine transport system ATPase subunit